MHGRFDELVRAENNAEFFGEGQGLEAWWVERLAGNIRGLLSPDQVINIFMLTC